MSKVKTFLGYVWHIPFLKYVLVCAFGIAIVGFWGDNSLLSHFRHQREVVELEQQIGQYNQQTERDMKRIRDLERNQKAIEKVARERYFMKTDDEDIFVLSEEVNEEEIED